MINYLSFVITGKCNSKCIMCNCWKAQNGYTSKQLIFDNVFKDSAIVENIEVVEFYGGEPLLRKDLLEIIFASIKLLKKLSKIVIITNGFLHNLLEEVCISTLCAIKKNKTNQILEIVISLDGIGSTHNHIRQVPNAFERVMRSVKKLKILKYKNKNFNFYFNTTISRLNINDVNNLISFSDLIYIRTHFSIVSAQEISISNSDTDIKQLNLMPERDKLLKLYKKLYQTSLESQEPLDIIQDYNDKIDYYSGKPRLIDCSYYTNSILIDWDGKCYLCPATKEGFLCDITESKISAYKQTIDKARKKIKSICQNCNISCSVYSSIVNNKLSDKSLTKLFYGISSHSIDISITTPNVIALFDKKEYLQPIPFGTTVLTPFEINNYDFDIVIAFIRGNRNETLEYLSGELSIETEKIFFYKE